jgi:hypothetical protein
MVIQFDWGAFAVNGLGACRSTQCQVERSLNAAEVHSGQQSVAEGCITG